MKPTLAPRKILHCSKLIALISNHVMYVYMLFYSGDEVCIFSPVCVCMQAEANMKKYGKQLMNELPDETTRLLTSLCTDWMPKGAEAVSC